MSKQEFFVQRPAVTPTIYVYNLPQVITHKGYVKVGYTDRDAVTRINEQMHTSGLTANILYTESAMCSDGSIFTDKDVHRILRRKGFRQLNEGNDRNEWFNCTVADVKAAIVELKTGIITDASRTATFNMRPEQHKAVQRTMEYFTYATKEDPGRPPKFLWNAKMRFGKTFASYQLARKGDETFIKAWLRAHYAETIRDTKAGAVNKDFDIIGGSFHKWVRDERDKLGLVSTGDFEQFIRRFAKFAEVYQRIRQAETVFAEDTKYVYYNAQVNFTLQPQLLLAPICYEDSWPVIIEKINLTARFIDILIMSRVTNYRSVDYSTIKNFVFNVTKDIRMCDIPTLKQKLLQQYINLDFHPEVALPDLGLNSFTKKYIKNILARVTSFIEESTGVAPNYCNYMNTQTKNPFEIEHIITDHYEWFTSEYTDQEDFRRWRNSIGALLLLHKSINASLNDSRYDYKLAKYCSNEGNIYTESLGQLAYQNNPKFKKFIADNGLTFRAYDQFGKAEISERGALLVQLVQLVWNDDMFK